MKLPRSYALGMKKRAFESPDSSYYQLVVNAVVTYAEGVSRCSMGDGVGQSWLKAMGVSAIDFSREFFSPEKFPSLPHDFSKDQLTTHGSANNWFNGSGLGEDSVAKILPLMISLDRDFSNLHDIHRKLSLGDVYDPRVEKVIKGMVGYWEEFHYSFSEGENLEESPVVVKGLLAVCRNGDIFYRIYEAEEALLADDNPIIEGEVYRYQGIATLEMNTLVLGLASLGSHTNEKISMRLERGRGRIIPKVYKGVLSGVSFSERAFTSKTVLRKRSDLGIPETDSWECDHPQKFLASDEDAIEAIGDSKEFFAYGPKVSRLHRRWDKEYSVLIGKIAKSLPDGSTIDIISTFVSERDKFFKMILDLGKDRAKRVKIRILMMDPTSDIFAYRYAIRAEDLNEFRDYYGRLIVQRNRLKDIAQEYFLPEDVQQGRDLEVRFTTAWQMGLCFKLGRKALFIGSVYATASPMEGHLMEVRDEDSRTWTTFTEEFDFLWNHFSSAEFTGDPTFGQVEKKWEEEASRIQVGE